jgi:hypothetical protein
MHLEGGLAFMLCYQPPRDVRGSSALELQYVADAIAETPPKMPRSPP